MHEDDAEDRAAILRRRALFIASAVAGLGVAVGCSDPQPCLSVAPLPHPSDTTPYPADTTTTANPGPCLTVLPADPPPDDAGAPPVQPPPKPADSGPPPQACLKVAPPRPCLTVVPPQPQPPGTTKK